MSRNAKIILGVIGVLVLVCCLAGAVLVTIVPRLAESFVKQTFIEDPEQAAEVGHSIVDYDLPAGYTEQGAMSFAGTKMIFIGSGDNQGPVIMLAQFPVTIRNNEGEMRQQLEQAFSQQRDQRNWDLSVVETEEVSINDQTVTLTTYEGTNEGGDEVRQVAGIFSAKNEATAMLMIMGSIRNWDETAVNEFLRSLQRGR